jgi:hypothetical protein
LCWLIRLQAVSNPGMRRRDVLILAAALLGGAAIFGYDYVRAAFVKTGAPGIESLTPAPHAELSGNILTIHPTGMKMTIPQDWLEWNQKYSRNIHIKPNELRKVMIGSGEWDTEYANVVNAILPFESCAAHLGGEGWGRDGVSFGDLQMRLYVLRSDVGIVENAIRNAGLDMARTIDPKGAVIYQSGVVSPSKQWRKITLAYNLFYGDYGGTAQVDFLIQRRGTTTTVIVLMHAAGGFADDEIPKLIVGIAWP